jgi:hypothetical protein
VTPGRGTGFTQTLTFTFTDTNGWQDISVANVLVNNAIDGRRACYLAYAHGALYLVDDAGDSGGPYSGMLLPPVPGASSISNGQCTIDGSRSFAAGNGNTLTLTLAVTFTQSFAGNQIAYAAARNNSGQNSGWQAVGTADVH